jgi:drug/metabolite transporter (DMT)-like permease
MSDRSRDLLQIHAAVFLFGFVALFGKFLDLPAFVIVFGRVVFASMALAAVSVWRHLPLRPRSRGSFLAFAGLGVLLAVHWTTFLQSVQVSSVAIAQVTFLTFPVFVALVEPPLFRERLRATDVVLALIALVGVAILVPSFDPAEGTTQGVLWGVASGLTFAFLALLNRRLVREHSSITLTLYQFAFAAVALLPFVVVSRPAVGAREVLLLLVLGVVCTAVAHALFTAGLRGVKARTASTITCLEPVYGVALAFLIRGEEPSVRTTVGGLVILGVAFYATLHPGKEEPAKDVPA